MRRFTEPVRGAVWIARHPLSKIKIADIVRKLIDYLNKETMSKTGASDGMMLARIAYSGGHDAGQTGTNGDYWR
jgi:hypothetical protein